MTMGMPYNSIQSGMMARRCQFHLHCPQRWMSGDGQALRGGACCGQNKMYWLHMHTVQMNGMWKGIPTKIASDAGRSVAGAPPRYLVGEGHGSGGGPKRNMFPF
eukprot:10312080-Ditylum_brightwellii.AAC.1